MKLARITDTAESTCSGVAAVDRAPAAKTPGTVPAATNSATAEITPSSAPASMSTVAGATVPGRGRGTRSGVLGVNGFTLCVGTSYDMTEKYRCTGFAAR